MTILHIFDKFQRNSEALGETIKKIKSGENHLRETLINDYKPYIIKTVSKTTGMYIDIENSEEFSVGLMAFNEAIDSFDADKYSGFINFAGIVIKRRVIDYIRKNEKNSNSVPLSYFYNNEENETGSFENKYFVVDSSSQFSNIETKEEIDIFIKRLNEFDIELSDLINNAPKHIDSKRLSIRIARVLAENNELSDKLERTKSMPVVGVMKLIKVSINTLMRNKKFIIAIYLILTSNLEVMQGYIKNIEKEKWLTGLNPKI